MYIASFARLRSRLRSFSPIILARTQMSGRTKLDSDPEESDDVGGQEQKPQSLKDAFSTLMSNSASQTSSSSTDQHPVPRQANPSNRRDNLDGYITRPQAYPSSRVIQYNDEYVSIHDAYPKSALHLLLLPRDRSKTWLHPVVAFQDPVFLQKTRQAVAELKKFAASELRRLYGRDNSEERAREEAMQSDPPVEHLPPGHDWENDIKCGIHAKPSMNNLHVHVMSSSKYNSTDKHRRHRPRFMPPYFIPLDAFPLDPDDKVWGKVMGTRKEKH